MKQSTLVTGFFCAFGLVSAIAADVYSVEVGDVYYLWRPDVPNIRVTVREVNRRESQVKIAMPGGEIRWVSASSLKTKDEATGTDIAAGAAVVGAALIICAIDPTVCKGKPTQSAPPGPPAEGNFKITNSCRHPVRVAIHYRDLAKDWKSEGWWDIQAGQSTYLANSSNTRLSTTAATWHYYAETSNDARLVWKGESMKRFGATDLPMIALTEKNGDSAWTLNCDGR